MEDSSEEPGKRRRVTEKEGAAITAIVKHEEDAQKWFEDARLRFADERGEVMRPGFTRSDFRAIIHEMGRLRHATAVALDAVVWLTELQKETHEWLTNLTHQMVHIEESVHGAKAEKTMAGVKAMLGEHGIRIHAYEQQVERLNAAVGEVYSKLTPAKEESER